MFQSRHALACPAVASPSGAWAEILASLGVWGAFATAVNVLLSYPFCKCFWKSEM